MSSRPSTAATTLARIARRRVKATSQSFVISRQNSSSTSTTSDSSASSSSSGSSSTWQPALREGVNPAYDASLAYLAEYTARTLARLETARSDPSTSNATLEALEIEAYVNDPATRWNFRRTGGGKGAMDQVVIRHLAERRWVKEGGLDLLMQRVEQMNVIPDVIPQFRKVSTVPLRIRFPSGEAEVDLEPGVWVSPSNTESKPTVTTQLFHHPEGAASGSGLYTLVVLDPDSPSQATQSYTQRIHYLKTGIPLSVLSGDLDLLSVEAEGTVQHDWEPLAPAKGSGPRRLVFLLIDQSVAAPVSGSENEDLPAWPTEREPFNLRKTLPAYESIIGLSLLRTKFSDADEEFINRIYRETRGEDAPVYDIAPKELRYGYPLGAKAAKREAIRREAWEKAVSDLEDVGSTLDELESAQAQLEHK